MGVTYCYAFTPLIGEDELATLVKNDAFGKLFLARVCLTKRTLPRLPGRSFVAGMVEQGELFGEPYDRPLVDFNLVCTLRTFREVGPHHFHLTFSTVRPAGVRDWTYLGGEYWKVYARGHVYFFDDGHEPEGRLIISRKEAADLWRTEQEYLSLRQEHLNRFHTEILDWLFRRNYKGRIA